MIWMPQLHEPGWRGGRMRRRRRWRWPGAWPVRRIPRSAKRWVSSSAPRGLCVVVCGAGPAAEVGQLIKLALERGWSVQVVSTSAGLAFLDAAAIEAQTGNPVRSQYRSPGGPRSRPSEAISVAPATYNTINKWAQGISDTYALGVLAETTGLGLPIVVSQGRVLRGHRPCLPPVPEGRQGFDVAASGRGGSARGGGRTTRGASPGPRPDQLGRADHPASRRGLRPADRRRPARLPARVPFPRRQG